MGALTVGSWAGKIGYRPESLGYLALGTYRSNALLRAFTFCVGLILCLPTHSARSDGTDYKPGLGWLEMTDSSRFTWTLGATQGQNLITEELGDTSKLIKDNLLPSGQVDTLANIITQYYQDAANTDIPWRYMAVVAAWKLAGRPETLINQRLESLRQYAAWAREHRNKTP